MRRTFSMIFGGLIFFPSKLSRDAQDAKDNIKSSPTLSIDKLYELAYRYLQIYWSDVPPQLQDIGSQHLHIINNLRSIS